MKTPDDKRQRLRMDFESQVALKFENPDQTLTATMKNISMNGIFVETDRIIALDSLCRVEVIITAPSSRVTIEAQGFVARHDPAGLGVKFKNDLEWFAFFPIFEYYGKGYGDSGLEYPPGRKIRFDFFCLPLWPLVILELPELFEKLPIINICLKSISNTITKHKIDRCRAYWRPYAYSIIF